MKKVLGLSIESNNIGYSLLGTSMTSSSITFDDILSNTISFSTPLSAVERKEGRLQRRFNERKSQRKRRSRRTFIEYGICTSDFLSSPSSYFEQLSIPDRDVYRLREKAVSGESLTKAEFALCVYSTLTARGYLNMFLLDSEKESKDSPSRVTGLIFLNKKEYLKKKLKIPSMVLTSRRDKHSTVYQNFPIRNKSGLHYNSLDRELYMDEFSTIVESQSLNTAIFKTAQASLDFTQKILSEEYGAFYQRPTRSLERLVEYCSFYGKFHARGGEIRSPLGHIGGVEVSLRKFLDSLLVISESNESRPLIQPEIDLLVTFWLSTPTANVITSQNVFKSAGITDLKASDLSKNPPPVNIKEYRDILSLFTEYKIPLQNDPSSFYTEAILVLYYFKIYDERAKRISSLLLKHNISMHPSFLSSLCKMEGLSGFGHYSLRFILEILPHLQNKDLSYSDALNKVASFDIHKTIPVYGYLPPLEPTRADIEWLTHNLPYFESSHLYYQPKMAPTVKRVISIIRKLVNMLISKYGPIDEINISVSKDMNSKKELSSIKDNKRFFNTGKSEAVKILLKLGVEVNRQSIEKVKLFLSQNSVCLYCGDSISLTDLFYEDRVKIDHFIPRSTIWIDSQKNKLLSHSCCADKKNSIPFLDFLNSPTLWADFQERVPFSRAGTKYQWLTNKDLLLEALSNPQWKDIYLRDTRTSAASIKEYLEHYLSPRSLNPSSQSLGTTVSVISHNAVSEIKTLWGLDRTISPVNTQRLTSEFSNFQPALDSFPIALFSAFAQASLQNLFLLKEKPSSRIVLKGSPLNSNLVPLHEHLRSASLLYESGEKLVVSHKKKKLNTRGFRSGNRKVFLSTPTKEYPEPLLIEREVIKIDTSLLFISVGGFDKPLKDKDVLKRVSIIQLKLDPIKQKKLIPAIRVYALGLLRLRRRLVEVESEIAKTLKESGKSIPLSLKKDSLMKKIDTLLCSFPVRGGKQQIVRTVRVFPSKIKKTRADSIVFQSSSRRGIVRLTPESFSDAKHSGFPFLIKANANTLCVELHPSPSSYPFQVIGLKFFSAISNPAVGVKFHDKYSNIFNGTSPSMVLYKNDVIKVNDLRNNSTEYYVFNGGGKIGETANALTVRNINYSVFGIPKPKGTVSFTQERRITLSKNVSVSKVKIDLLGSITEP